jgi:hypothetical protein
MQKPSKRTVISFVSIMAILMFVVLLAWLKARPKVARHFFGSAPNGVTLHFLGSATNYLKFDRGHNWKAFSVSNGTSKTFSYTVTEVEYRSVDGWLSAGSWLSNSLAGASLMTHRQTAGEISPGSSDVFFASITSSSVPWRLRIGCWEANWSDRLNMSISRFREKLQRLPPSNTKSWSGGRYELISAEITP